MSWENKFIMLAVSRIKPIKAGAKRGFIKMEDQPSVLGLLRRARDLLAAGQHTGIIDAIATMQGQASGPKRDLAYFAILDTASEARGAPGMSVLAAASREASLALIDATIKRITSKMH